MLDLPIQVSLFNIDQASNVRAELIQLTSDIANEKIDNSWWDAKITEKLEGKEADKHWNWHWLNGVYGDYLNWEAIAVQSASGYIEGAITYRIDAKSQLSEGQGPVYVDRLAAAPRNRPWLVENPVFRGVGSILLLTAVRHSYQLGLKGRVLLDSLPSERTRNYYDNRGFEVTSEKDDGTIGYELPATAAEKWLQEQGEFL
ncbi:MAG: hypothetical protein COA78_14705 [Blastopirellula sp.]|nr:MAG: hypothetical protein COA78_14705 [Blastopirellula sp.]